MQLSMYCLVFTQANNSRGVHCREILGLNSELLAAAQANRQAVLYPLKKRNPNHGVCARYQSS